MTKNQTNNATQTTVTTVTTTETTLTTTVTTSVPVGYMPINPLQDKGAEDYYKQHGIPVRTMNRFGKNRLYAIIPGTEFDIAEGEDMAERVDAFSHDIDAYRRKVTRANKSVMEYEVSSLDSMFEAGYDPTLDSIDIAIKISKKVNETVDEESEDEQSTTDTETSVDDDEYEYTGKKSVCRGGYDASNDLDNPEYICAKNILYSKMYAMIDELDGEDLEIVTAIMTGVSERELAKKLGVARTTLQAHREKLMARFRDVLGDDYE